MTLYAYPCPRCHGDRNEPDAKYHQCTECYGNGVLYTDVMPWVGKHQHVTDEPPSRDDDDLDACPTP